MSQDIFQQVSMTKPNSNVFDLSHERKLSMRMGELVPINLMETVPGDKFNINTSQLVRLAPMIAPMMHSVNVYVHYFFVPNRILWDGWEEFITGGETGQNDRVFPYISIDWTPWKIGGLADHIGYPVEQAENLPMSAIPMAAYIEIWNEYYRDQNLQEAYDNSLTDGRQNNPSVVNDLMNERCLKRAWQHDYFTSALPWTQRGPEALIPLGETAPIFFDPVLTDRWRDDQGNTITSTTISNVFSNIGTRETTNNIDVNVDNSENLFVDLTEATASSIIDLRRAFKLQEWLEKNARSGSRYKESIMAHFGVKTSDGRLQRPEFLGGSSSPVSISEVLQTSDAAAQETPQGNMAGHGISVGASRNISYYCEEHGYIMGIMSVLPKSGYQQGLARHFSKFDKFDYYWPEFAHIGEQAIYNKEIYALGGFEPSDDEVFGYTPRYIEYKHIPSSVHGDFKTSLDFWHMGRKFDEVPVLNESFIQCDPTERIFAVQQDEHLYVHVYNKVKARRKMPYFGNPSM